MSDMLENDLKREAIVKQLKQLMPGIEIVGIERKLPQLVYYTASYVKNEIVIEKHERHIYINDKPENLLRDKFFSAIEVKTAINQVLPKAQKKFDKCLKSFQAMTQDLNFNYGFNYDGDTYGIYNEYEYISFKMDNFYFRFEVSQ